MHGYYEYGIYHYSGITNFENHFRHAMIQKSRDNRDNDRIQEKTGKIVSRHVIHGAGRTHHTGMAEGTKGCVLPGSTSIV
jgi:hypothetical protein